MRMWLKCQHMGIWKLGMCGMWPLVWLGIPTLSKDELFTLIAFYKRVERVSEHPVWWHWGWRHVCIYGEVKFYHNSCRPCGLKYVWVNELWHKIIDHNPHTQTQHSLCSCHCLRPNWILLGLHGYLLCMNRSQVFCMCSNCLAYSGHFCLNLANHKQTASWHCCCSCLGSLG